MRFGKGRERREEDDADAPDPPDAPLPPPTVVVALLRDPPSFLV